MMMLMALMSGGGFSKMGMSGAKLTKLAQMDGIKLHGGDNYDDDDDDE